MQRYIVETSSLAGRCAYRAKNPDHAIILALRHEVFMTAITNKLGIPWEKAKWHPLIIEEAQKNFRVLKVYAEN